MSTMNWPMPKGGGGGCIWEGAANGSSPVGGGGGRGGRAAWGRGLQNHRISAN